MKLYTFILEYRGGTYINQIQSFNAQDALKNWIDSIDTSSIYELEHEQIHKIHRSLKDDGFVAISGVCNVWCFNFNIEGHMGLVNFVSTSHESEK